MNGDTDSWRVTVTCGREADGDTLFARLDERKSIESVGGSLGHEGAALFAYGSTQEQVEQMVALIKPELRLLRLAPETAVIDEWLPHETRWSSEEPPAASDEAPSAVDGSRPDWIGALIDALGHVPLGP